MWLREAVLPDIQAISLKGDQTNGDVLRTLRKFSTLKSMSLEDTRCVCNSDLQNLVENVSQLTCLEIKSMTISDLGVEYICKHLVHLETLKLSSKV